MKKIVLLIVLAMTISTAENLMTPKFDCQDDEEQVCAEQSCVVLAVYCPTYTVCDKDGNCRIEGGCNNITCTQNCHCRKKRND